MKPKQAVAATVPHESGELHRRVSRIMELGLLNPAPRAGLMAFLQFRQWADFKKCRFTVSVRTLAKRCQTSVGSAHRGLQNLIDAGVLKEHKSPSTQYRVFEIIVPRAPRSARQRAANDRGGKAPWKKVDETQQEPVEEKPWD